MGLPLEVEFADAPGESKGDIARTGMSRAGGGIGGGGHAFAVKVVVKQVADADT